MANSKAFDEDYRQVSVDTQPASDDGFTDEVNMKGKSGNIFSLVISGTGTMEVTLQYKEPGNDTWTDHEAFTSNGVHAVESRGDIKWRAGVKDGTSVDAAKKISLLWETY